MNAGELSYRRCFLIMVIVLFYNNTFSQSPVKGKPNIIFILVDDQGYGDLGVFYQNQRAALHDNSKPYEISPNLDILAKEGTILTDHYCAAPVCAPSRASLLLGVSQGIANVRDNQFDKAIEDNYNIAFCLKKIGYSTAAIGKWGLEGNDKWDVDGYKWPGHPLKRGFDYFFGYMRHSDGHEHYPKNGLYRLYWAEKEKEVWQNYKNITPVLDKCYTADLWIAAAKRYIINHLKGRDKNKPFFLYLAFDTPHAVLELPTEKYPAGKGLNGGMKWLGTPGHFINTAEGKVDSYIYPEYAHAVYKNDSTGQLIPWPETFKRYATANRRIDDGVGDVRQLLKDLHIDSNTIVIYTSDNGPSIESYLPEKYAPNHPTFFSSYGPFDGIKCDNWEGGVRIPTIARWPGHIKAGKIISEPSISYDWAPTFFDIAGIPSPVRMDGVSLKPALTGIGEQQKGLIYIEYFADGNTPDFEQFEPNHRGRIRRQMQLLRLGDYVGVRYDIKSADDNFEIYNVKTDPKEKFNLNDHQNVTAGKDIPVFTNHGIKELTVKGLEDFMKGRVLQVRHSNISATRPYDSALIPQIEIGKVLPGVDWQIYQGNFPWIPNIKNMISVEKGHSANIDVSLAEKENSGILFFNGYIKVPADGMYNFYMATDTKAYLRIHDIEVIDEDFSYSGDLTRQQTLFLKAGLHPFSLYYYSKKENGVPFLKVAWSSSFMKRQPLKSFLFSEVKKVKENR